MGGIRPSIPSVQPSLDRSYTGKTAAIVLCLVLFLMTGCSEFDNKSEYAVLQEASLIERESVISNVEIIYRRGYIIAGFRADNGRVNTWVLLNPKNSPFYKQTPQVQFTITREDLDQIRHIDGVSETVIAVLQTRVREQ